MGDKFLLQIVLEKIFKKLNIMMFQKIANFQIKNNKIPEKKYFVI